MNTLQVLLNKWPCTALLIVLCACGAARAEIPPNDYTVLCYHDVPTAVTNDPYAVDLLSFVQQLDYMRSHGYRFIRVEDIVAARKGERALPEKAVLLTFDDGLRSFYENVLPVLDLYRAPAVLAVCSSWIEGTRPPDLPPLMTWEQIRAAASNDLVTIASHSHDLHKAVLYTPQCNAAHAATSRRFLPTVQRYETEPEYRGRLRADFETALTSLQTNAGIRASVFVWPYGQYNQVAAEEARNAGFDLLFALGDEKPNTTNSLRAVRRWLIEENPSILRFADQLKRQQRERRPNLDSRALELDLDRVYAAAPERLEQNLNACLDRIVAMDVSAVYVNGVSDLDGDGAADAAWFPNPVLPMRMDLLARVVNQLVIRGVQVYVRMPVLDVDLPAARYGSPDRIATRTGEEDATAPPRLSPFSPRAETAVRALYEALAVHVRLTGVLFAGDARLGLDETFDAAALAAVPLAVTLRGMDPSDWDEADRAAWTAAKTQRLDEFTLTLADAVRTWRPQARFARTLFAPVVTEPGAAMHFAQDYGRALEQYDFVLVRDRTAAEGARRSPRLLARLAETARVRDPDLARTIFRIEAFDPQRIEPFAAEAVTERIRSLVAAGARHVAYGPDDFAHNAPDLTALRTEMSLERELTPRPRVPKPYAPDSPPANGNAS